MWRQQAQIERLEEERLDVEADGAGFEAAATAALEMIGVLEARRALASEAVEQAASEAARLHSAEPSRPGHMPDDTTGYWSA